MVLLCRHNSGMLGEDSAAEDIDMADAEQQVVLLAPSIWIPVVNLPHLIHPLAPLLPYLWLEIVYSASQAACSGAGTSARAKARVAFPRRKQTENLRDSKQRWKI